ncbi:DUF3553 domain-containing protein [Mucisphaera sp.]|uniref:DUF3553 domain-containing protein n=1 Tax=Mucisphaera sp. TaxID=2913024 RepID=UPI003D0EF1ED
MPEALSYQTGQVVTHPKRPEWGRGVVRQVEPITHHGVNAQRVAVDFANKGRVVVNTAIASLVVTGSEQPATAATKVSPRKTPSNLIADRGSERGAGEPGERNNGWLTELEQGKTSGSGELWSLPLPMADPFASLKQRLLSTLESYRFTTEPRSLIEWAVTQTGLDDPLSQYTRSELEQAFPRFCRDRDNHLADLIRTAKRQMQHSVLDEVRAEIDLPAAHKAMHKASRAG